jgi:radical SAM superfamily enzyme YgiQ (UPF0313 family)
VDQPYPSIPMLVSFLKYNGVRDVEQFDANIDSFYYFTRKLFLQECMMVVRRMMNRRRSDKDFYQYACETALFYPEVIKNIGSAIRFFKDSTDTNMDEYAVYKNIIERAFDIVSAAYYPTFVSPKNFSMRYSNQSFAEIQKAMISQENPYVRYFKERLLGKLRNKHYRAIGISITALSQIIPSFTLASIIKESFPETKIIFGGQVFNRLEENIKKIPAFFNLVDYLIMGEGETALLRLIEYLDGKREIHEVPNMIYYDKQIKSVVETPLKHREKIQDIPPPDYSGLPLKRYLAPSPVLSYQTARGCYWSRCTFCNQFLIAGKGLRYKRPEEMAGDLQHLSETYNTHFFSLVNESLPPSILRKLAESLIHKRLRIRWYSGARFDRRFDTETLRILRQGGCEKLYFGLESGNQKILSEMNKGTRLDVIKRILQDAKEIGIGVHLFIMIGFPTETMEDLTSSKEFISDILDYMDKDSFSFYISIFQLKPKTPIFDKPDSFNIRTISKKEGYDLEYLYQFETSCRPSDLDYEAERQHLESLLDGIAENKKYPENIVHFLTFRDRLVRYDKRYMPKIYANEHTVGKRFSNYNSKPISYLLYNFYSDNLYEISDYKLWKMLLSIKRPVDLDFFQNTLSETFGIDSRRTVRDFTKKLIQDKILLEVRKQ